MNKHPPPPIITQVTSLREIFSLQLICLCHGGCNICLKISCTNTTLIWHCGAHYHSYERTCAVYKRKCVQDGVTHITIGTAGKEEDIWLFEKKEWSLFYRRDDPYGYGRVMVANRSALHWEYFVNSEDAVVDEVWLTKKATHA